MIQNLVVLGTGLIGSSIAKAAKQANFCNRVWAVNRSAATAAQAASLDIADHSKTYHELGEIISQLTAGDIVLVAVPMGVYQSVFAQLAPMLPERVIVTDVGSSKATIVEAAEKVWGSIPDFFVPGHPIAGSEKAGVTAVDPDLYINRRCILTPVDQTDASAVQSVRALWESVGATVDTMEVAHHDEVLAATSHLPHVLAYSLVDALFTLDQKSEVFRYAAGGFKDFTRIAESDPTMWRDIFVANRDAILAQLDNFELHLAALRDAIESTDQQKIMHILERSQSARKMFSDTYALIKSETKTSSS